MAGNPLKNKVAVVTGGASGIGLATCRRLLESGCRIAVIDHNEKALETFRQRFGHTGSHILTLLCDVTRETECYAAIKSILDHYKRIDILFNNAGITQRGLFEHTRVSVYEKIMAVNFFGALYCTKAALPALIKSRGSILVNESIAGVAPLLGRTGYSASKHALHGLFTSLRCELRHKGVHVMIVCPGFIQTNLQKTALGADGKIAVHEQTRFGREDTPENAARQIVKGLIKRKSMLVLTRAGQLGYLISRISPLLYEILMSRQFKIELDVKKPAL